MTTRTKRQTGKPLESQVANLYRRMGARKVVHDLELVGNQIDVYVEMESSDKSLHRLVIEAKDWDRAVGIAIVNHFITIINNLSSQGLVDEGIIVSNKGFTRPARNAASVYRRLRLSELEDLTSAVNGWARSLRTSIRPKLVPKKQKPSKANVLRAQQVIKETIAGFIKQMESIGVEAQDGQNIGLSRERLERLSRIIRAFLAENVSGAESDMFYSKVYSPFGGWVYDDPVEDLYKSHITIGWPHW